MSLIILIITLALIIMVIRNTTTNKEGMRHVSLTQLDAVEPTYFDYNYRRGALFAPTRRGMMNYYYYRPYGLKKY